MAAILACGHDAVLSHRSAAALWGLRPSARPVTDVTAPGRSRRRRAGIALHLVRHLDERDRAVEDGLPVTTVARTLLDLAEEVPPHDLGRAMEEAERLRLLNVRTLEEVVDRCRGRRGLRPLRLALETYRPAPDTRSELERRFARLCRDAGLPRPAVNVLVAGVLVDAVWQDRMLVVELDGRAYHGTREAFERDRIRDATLQVAGYRVLRLTHRRLLREPGHVVRTIRLLLTARPAPSA